MWLERQLEYRLAHLEPGWRGRELDDRAADVTREPIVGERDRMPRMDRCRRPAARRALVAAHLEQIGEVGLELPGEADRVAAMVEVTHGQAFIDPRLPNELRAHDMDRVLRQTQAPGRIEKVGIGQVGGQERVVVLDDRAEQQRPTAVDQKLQAGEVARVLVVDALGAARYGHHVAVMIEHAEGVAVLEGAWPSHLQRRRRRDVKLHQRRRRRGLFGAGRPVVIHARPQAAWTAPRASPSRASPCRAPRLSRGVGTGMGRTARERVIHRYVVLGHPLGGEALLKARADRGAIQPVQVGHGGARPGNVLDDPARPAVIEYLRDRAAAISDHRGATSHRLDHHEPERLWPVDREQQAHSVAQERRLVPIADLPDVLDQWVAQQRADHFVEVDLIDAVDLGRDLERYAGTPRDLDRVIRPLLGADPSEKGEIAAAGVRREGIELRRQPVVHRAQPVPVGARPPLVIGDRHERELGEDPIRHGQIGQIQPSMLGSQRKRGKIAEQREMQVVDMEVQDVEFGRPPAHPIEHDHVIGQRIPNRGLESERLLRARRQFRRSQRVAAREQGDLVSLADQLLGKIGGDPLRAAVQAGWHAFDQRRDLRNSHSGCLHAVCAQETLRRINPILCAFVRRSFLRLRTVCAAAVCAA